MIPAKSSPEARRRGDRAHRVGLITNGLLAIAKIAVGLLAGSPALLADGWHSLSDIAVGAVAWTAWRFSSHPPDDDHHYGHGNIEAAAGLGVGLVLIGGGAAILWSVIAGGGEGAEPGARGLAALGMALVSIAANTWLVRVTLSAARELSSPTLHALARDNRGDVLTGILVVVGVSASLAGLRWVEPTVAVLIGLLVVLMGWKSAREGFDVLMDRVSDPSLREQIRGLAEAVPGVRGVQDVRVHPLGASYRIDMEISVDGQQTVSAGHTIAHDVERAITREIERVVHVQVHVNPAQARGEGRDVVSSERARSRT